MAIYMTILAVNGRLSIGLNKISFPSNFEKAEQQSSRKQKTLVTKCNQGQGMLTKKVIG
jgi:hypothetical protein